MKYLIGVYIAGAIFTFAASMFFAVLGGDESDLWKPFACALAWPVVVPWWIWGP